MITSATLTAYDRDGRRHEAAILRASNERTWTLVIDGQPPRAHHGRLEGAMAIARHELNEITTRDAADADPKPLTDPASLRALWEAIKPTGKVTP